MVYNFSLLCQVQPLSNIPIWGDRSSNFIFFYSPSMLLHYVYFTVELKSYTIVVKKTKLLFKSFSQKRLFSKLILLITVGQNGKSELEIVLGRVVVLRYDIA